MQNELINCFDKVKYEYLKNKILLDVDKELALAANSTSISVDINNLNDCSKLSFISSIVNAGLLGLSLSPDEQLCFIERVNVSGGTKFSLRLSLKGILKVISSLESFSVLALTNTLNGCKARLEGDVMGFGYEQTINVFNDSFEDVKGTICILEMQNKDQIITVINRDEIDEIISLTGLQPYLPAHLVGAFHVIKRALKNIPAKSGTRLEVLKKVTRDLDLDIFN